MEQWRTCLRALGIKLAVISVCSFACKAVLVALNFFGAVSEGSSVSLSLSTLLVEALPSLLTITLLIRYHMGSMGAARGSDIGVSLLHRATGAISHGSVSEASEAAAREPQHGEHSAGSRPEQADVEQGSEAWLKQFMANGRVIEKRFIGAAARA